ncbi:putative ribonuclease H-like domain-containing protein [Tanacetum coccineum]|uniref:Ribonuclease H-like domain-containing protein n=1 Tax=Tanacetum coccineum TaxID=301880 RepID=A0ABQ5BCS2_9ASTR
MAYTSQGSSSSSSSDSEYDVQAKDISIKDLKNQLEEALKEKDDLKHKLENFEELSKNLTKLINSQISAKDKTGLGYDSQINKSELNNIHMNKCEVVHSVFNSRESDVDDSPVNDRFKTGKGFHAVPPPYTGNYMPSRPDLSFAGLDDSVYKTKVSETETSISKTSKDIVEKPKTVRPSAPIIEDWDTDSDNDSVFRPKSDQTKPKFTKINFVKSDENVKSVNKENTHRQVEYPRKIATKSGQVPVNAAKQSSPRAATSISTARPKGFNQKSAAKTNNFNEKVNTARVNNVTTARPKTVVSAAEGNGENIVKSSACWIWRPIGNVIDYTSKDNYQEVDGGFELKFNLFFVSQMCDKKNNVLFTETECLVLSPDFKLLDESQVLLKVPRQNNMYSFDLKNVVPSGGKRAIGTKWVYRNKKEEREIVVRNKDRLVAQGYTQEEGINYDEVFALVARIEAIRLFLAYASFMGFIVYQMDVKSAFLYGTIEEGVYVCQPPSFEDPMFPDKVYKVEKALYGLHQAPKAWYETLSTYLLENGYRRGTIDKNLFIKKDRGDILLVQVYVDDIIFGSTKKSLCVEFEQMMHKRFQMSSMRELTFFLGLQVMQKDDGIFISQDKYVADILKNFDFVTIKTAALSN